MNKATAQELDDVFLGSGALSYPWYGKVDISTTPEGGWSLSFEDAGMDEPGGQYVITDQKIWHTVKMIASKDGEGIEYLGTRARKDCQTLVFKGFDEADFDADTADQVIQVSAFGKVIYS